MIICCGVACFAANEKTPITADNLPQWLLIIILLNAFLTIVGLVFLYFFFLKRRGFDCNKSSKDEIVKVVQNSERINIQGMRKTINDIVNWINNEKNTVNYEDKINRLERQIGELKNEVDKCKTTSTSVRPPFINHPPVATTTYGTKFFRSKEGKFLTEEVPDKKDASFKVFNIKGNDASFEYCGEVRNQDFFTDVCKFENNPQDVPDKTKIISKESGKVRKDANNNWEVISLATIKFE